MKEQLKQRLIEVWSGAQLAVVDEAIDEWRWRSGLVSMGDSSNIYCNNGYSEFSANIFYVKGLNDFVFRRFAR